MKIDKVVDALGGAESSYVAEAAAIHEDSVLRMQPQSRAVTRRNFVRVGAAAAAVGVASFLGFSIFGKGGNDGRSFVLTAYAEGTDQGDGTRLPLANFAGSGFYGPPNGDIMYDACYSFELGCTVGGQGAKSVTYELEGPYCNAQAIGDDDATCVYFFNFSDGIGDSTSITVPYGEQGSKECQICAHFPMSERLQEANDRYQAASAEASEAAFEAGTNQPIIDPELEKAWDFESRLAFNEYLATTTLHISVTYDDGKLLEKRYAIAAIEDFEEVYDAYLDTLKEMDELANESGGYDLELSKEYFRRYENQPPLYTVRELEG